MQTDNDELRRAELRAEELRREELRRAEVQNRVYEDRRGRGWIAPVVVLIAVVGLGWWVWSATNDEVGRIPDTAIDTPVTTPLPNNAPIVPPANVQPEVGINAPPVTPAPALGAPDAPGNIVPNPGNLGVAQATTTATGRVDQFDPLRRTLTLENGDTYLLAATVAGVDTIVPGQAVTLTYRMDNDRRIVESIRPNTTTPDANPVAPAPLAPNAAPLNPGAVPMTP